MTFKMISTSLVKPQTEVNQLSATNFQNTVLDGDSGHYLVLFWAKWSRNANKMKQFFPEIATHFNGQLKLGTFDTDASLPSAVLGNKDPITSIPTCILFYNGKKVFQSVGFKNQATLAADLNEHVNK